MLIFENTIDCSFSLIMAAAVPVPVVILHMSPRFGDRHGVWEGSIVASRGGWRLSVVTQRYYDPTAALSTEPQYYDCTILRETPKFEVFNLFGDDDPTLLCSMTRIGALAAIIELIDESGNLSDDVRMWWKDFCQTNQ